MSQSTYPGFQQVSFFDRLYSLSDKQIRKLEKGWPGVFKNEILPKLVELETYFAPLYSDTPNSRPSTPTYLVLAFFLLKALFGMTDDQLVEAVHFNIEFQYALGTTSLSDQPINQRTLNRFRAAVSLYEQKTGIDLMEIYFYGMADRFVEEFVGTKRMRRMDSILIDNGCRKLSRLQTAHAVIRNALDLLEEEQKPIQQSLHHYIEDFDENKVTYHDHRPAQVKQEEAFRDALSLYNDYPEDLKDSEEYLLLERFVNEQIDRTEDGKFLAVREGKKLTSTTLNNPAEPESTIRTKAGETHQGYVGNFAETVDLETNRKIIDSASFQQNIYSDSRFAKDEIVRMAQSGNTDALVVDGAYSSVDNVNLAAEKGIQLLGTDLAGNDTPDLYADFKIDEEQKTVICPYGRRADRVSVDKKDDSIFSVSFFKKECSECPYQNNCPLKEHKRVRSGKVSNKMIQRANLQRRMNCEDYKKIRCFRNGVEAIPSQLRRNQNIDHMPYKGLVRKKLGYWMSLLAINVRRVLQYGQEDHKKGLQAGIVSLIYALFVIFFEKSQTNQTQIKVAQ